MPPLPYQRVDLKKLPAPETASSFPKRIPFSMETANNVNYDSTSSGLATEYTSHPSSNKQPFFHTIPSMDDNGTVRRHQERFVDKMLSISLGFRNVLYCMNNETLTSNFTALPTSINRARTCIGPLTIVPAHPVREPAARLPTLGRLMKLPL